MVARIEVSTTVFDTRVDIRQKQFAQCFFHKKIKNVFLLDVYTIDKNFSQEQLEKIASKLCNPVTQQFVIRQPEQAQTNDVLKPFTFAIEIGFLPGVTDNVSHTTKELIQDLLHVPFTNEENTYTSQIICIQGDITKKQAAEIAENFSNPLIQRVHIKTYEAYKKDGGMDFIVPKVALHVIPRVLDINLAVSDEELGRIGKEGIADPDGTRRGPLSLDLAFMKTIQAYFKKLGRSPTDIELESIAQTWSEHCKHTIFNDPIDDIHNGLFKTYIKAATEEIRKKDDFCVSVFTDNSGAIVFDDDWLITHKVETHNSPSALDPFGGAVTGIVGVNRDTLGFGLGAKPVANYYGFCLADPRVDKVLYRGKNKTQKMLSSQRIMEGVVSGVNVGGNQSGIPTPQGFIYFDEKYRGKPLVFVGTVGVIPKYIKGKKSWVKKAMPGDYIVMVGGRVGKDGIHGATFSSEALDSASPVTAVQIGDPITQKKMSDVLIKEARDELLYHSITDNGAGGLSCSVSEMAKESGGCIVTLENVPLKYAGLHPWEIWISESQERMTLAVPKEKWERLKVLMDSRGVEASVIGEFTNSGKCVVKYTGKILMDLDMDFLHNGLPQRPMKTKEVRIEGEDEKNSGHTPEVYRPLNEARMTEKISKENYNGILLDLLSSLNITSYSFISQQYDYIVQGNSVLPPLQGRGRVNADTSAFRPLLSSKKAVLLSQGLYPEYSEIDAYTMAAASIDTAIRNIVAAGGNPDYIALLDNFCWCSVTEPERLYQLKQAAKACYDYAVAYGTPFISGKDSMFNDFKGYDEEGNPIKISIPPTLLISSLGVIDDITKTVSLDAKQPGDFVYLLGETFEETIPSVNAQKNKKLYDAFYRAIQKNLVASSISIGRGGILIAAAKKAIGGMLGIDIDLKNLPGALHNDDCALFSESQGRMLVTICPENATQFEKLLAGNSIAKIGYLTSKEKFVVKGIGGETIIDIEIDKMLEAYRKTFKDY